MDLDIDEEAVEQASSDEARSVSESRRTTGMASSSAAGEDTQSSDSESSA